jgi:hypothetical protein
MARPLARSAAVAILASLTTLAGPAVAQQATGGDLCLTDPVMPAAQPPRALRLGITPQPAGSAGVAQQAPVPYDDAALDRALLDLRGSGRELVVRLNRLFFSEGDAGIERFAALADRYAALGLGLEVQVRYHPDAAQEGDQTAWEAFVRRAATVLGSRRALVALSIVNEPNLPISPNTSDGVYAGVREAIVRGVVAARESLDAAGRPDVQVGFTFAWRWAPQEDRAFWRELGERGTAAFHAALDYVGLQVYPGLVWPPAPLPGRTAGAEVVEAAALVRTCMMPLAGLGPDVALWISENGYATNLGRTEAGQDTDLRSTVAELHRTSGTLGITDYRWFNLRDNDSDGTDLFSAVGLLRDDHTRKPSFAALQQAIAEHGTRPAPPARTPAAARRCRGSRALPRGRWRSARPAQARGTARVAHGRLSVTVSLRRPAARRRVGVKLIGRGANRRRVVVVVRCARVRATGSVDRHDRVDDDRDAQR